MIGPNATNSVRFERSRETLAPAPQQRVSTTLDTNGVARPGATTDARQADLRKAAEAFEAVFLRQVIGSMRQAKLADDMFGSAATDQFRNLADSRLADDMADQGSFGIAELLLQQFKGAATRQAPAPAGPASATINDGAPK